MPKVELLTGIDVGKTRSLWEEVFREDTKSFVDYYYTHKAWRNICFVMKDEDDIVSMVHLTPYDMCIVRDHDNRDKNFLEELSAFYIVGVATKELHRHKGYMTLLLENAFSYMRENGVSLAFLMPANPAIYEPFGFQYIYARTDYQFCPELITETENLELRRATHKDCQMLASYAMEQLSETYRFFLKRDPSYYDILLKELASENGGLYLIYVKGKFAGYFTHACETEEFVQEVVIKEEYESDLIVNLDEDKKRILRKCKEKKPIIMGKYINTNSKEDNFLINLANGKIKNGFINELV